MRQNLLVIGALLIAIAAAVFISEHERATPMDDLLNELEASVKAGRWEAVRGALARLTEQWERGKGWLALGNAARDIDDFERTLGRLRAYADTEDPSEALAAIAELKSIWRTLEKS